MTALKRLVREVHRRSLWQVMSIYLMGSWGALQVVEGVTQNAGLPDWVPSFALVLLVIGLPITVATAFIQEGLPGRGDTTGPDFTSPSERTSPSDGTIPSDGALPFGGQPEALASSSSTPTPTAAAGLFTWRNAIMGGVAAGFLLVASAAVYLIMWTLGVGPVGSLVAQGVIEARDPIILAQFENRTDDEMLGAVVTDALRVDLLESQVVTLIDGRLVDEVLQRMGRPTGEVLTGAIAREVAVREGIKAVIEGDVSRVGSGYVLAARVVVPDNGTTLAAFRESATGDGDILAAIDRLSQRLREKAGESLREIRAGEALEAVTTSSLEALRLFAQANQAEEAGDVRRTIALLEEALALDSTFAMAWRKLAVQHSNRGGDRDAQIRAAGAAFRHRDRLTQRERYLAEAYYHYTVTRDEEATAQAYRRVLEGHPHDPAALNNLGLYYGDKEDWAEAAALYQRAVEGPGRSRSAYNNLVIALYNQGKKDEAERVLDEWAERYELEFGMVRHRFTVRWGRGDPAGAEAVAREGLVDLSEDVFAQIDLRTRLTTLLEAQGRLSEARTLYLEQRGIAEAQGLAVQAFSANTNLAWLDLLAGGDTLALLRRLEGAMETELADVPALNRPYGGMAFMWAVAGRDAARARHWWARANAVQPDEVRQSAAFQETLLFQEGMLHFAERRPAEALETFQDLRRRQDNCDECYQRQFAEIYAALQQPDSAIAYLEQWQTRDDFDFVGTRENQLGEVLPQLARLYERVGRTEDAAAAWTRFADRWADADAVLQPRVRRARAEAERLRAGG